MKHYIYLTILLPFLLAQCTQPADNTSNKTNTPLTAKYKAVNTTYALLRTKDSIRNITRNYTPAQLAVLYAVNRMDSANITRQDSVIIPANLNNDVNAYSPFPQTLPFARDINKIVFFSYPAQYFAAYEHGVLIHSGPTNMGREKDPTPTGLFFTNWKAEETKSTFNDEWELKWNFNIQNKEGVGWHQYTLPGYPASHSCLRMLESDARFMYNWADQWTVKGTDEVLAQGTPVIVFGSYPFGGAKPWMKLTTNPQAMNITADQLQKETAPHLEEIMKEQQKRAAQSAN
jgi:lipoprotein-anchoring transpeptidase ErfK/SrfK